MSEDVKTEDLETSSEESTEENLEDESKEADESKDVPYTRFKKVIEERNRLREEAEALRRKQETLNETLNPKPVKEETPKTDSLSREEAILYAKGKNDDQIAYAKKVAELEGVSITEALDSPLYTAWEEKQSVDNANNAAQIGASRSSAPHRENTIRPGMSKDEHKEMWNKLRNQ